MKTGNNICPHCSSPISQLEVDDILLNVDSLTAWRGFSFGCPSCRKVISVEMKPMDRWSLLLGRTPEDAISRISCKYEIHGAPVYHPPENGKYSMDLKVGNHLIKLQIREGVVTAVYTPEIEGFDL